MRYETRGFDEYIYIYDEKNKMLFYSVEMDFAKPKRVLYSAAGEKLCFIDFGTDDLDDLVNGYPIYMAGKKIGYYDDSPLMEATGEVEFAHIVGPEWHFIDMGERLTFRGYKLEDRNGDVISRIKRPGSDFVCDFETEEQRIVALALSVISVEYWHYIKTTREA